MTQTQTTSHDPAEFASNMAKAADACQHIWQEFVTRHAKDFADKPFDPLNIGQAFGELFTKLMSDPAALWEKQMQLWQDYLGLWQNVTERAMGEESKPFIEPDAKDRRFKDEAWQQSALFDFLKQSYLLTARWLRHTVGEAQGLDQHTAHKVDFYTRQLVDAMSPSNFLLTNPEVLKATIDSGGENLVKGLNRLLSDIENDKISMTDFSAFKVGKNLAITPGKVIFQNDLMQLIQYSPTTKDVHQTPLLLIPAWINKYYILDLQPENSLVKFLMDSGYTVFMISWVNPDKKHARKTFDDYMAEGPLAAMDAIEKATGERNVSIIGYCLGGTLLAMTLAWLAAKGESDRVASSTFLTTMTDFTDAGELSVFIDEEQIQMLEARMAQTGYLEGKEMATTFNMLRANDLIWSFVVNNYLLGKDPFPFDLLYWNADSTRMPARMHSYYLRNMYQKNLLVKPGALSVCGEKIDLTRITTPSYFLSTREDHIAPWKSTYAATQIFKGPMRFVLAASGHIAGVVNPPAKNKYCHWVSENLPKTAEEWFKNAREDAGSWWPDWFAWHKPFAGGTVPARKPARAIEDAPGSYVKVMS